jgi:hypothetical protein
MHDTGQIDIQCYIVLQNVVGDETSYCSSISKNQKMRNMILLFICM